MSYVFISYKSEEVEYAQSLRDELVRLGYEVWWARDVQTSGKWNEQIDHKLAHASCVIVLWSQRAIESKWVAHEASYAISRAAYVPCAIETVAIPAPFRRFQTTSLAGWDGSATHEGFAQILARLEALLKQPPRVPADTRPFRVWPTRVQTAGGERLKRWTAKHVVTILGVGVVGLVLVLAVGGWSLRSRVSDLTKTNSNVQGELSEVRAVAESERRRATEERERGAGYREVMALRAKLTRMMDSVHEVTARHANVKLQSATLISSTMRVVEMARVKLHEIEDNELDRLARVREVLDRRFGESYVALRDAARGHGLESEVVAKVRSSFEKLRRLKSTATTKAMLNQYASLVGGMIDQGANFLGSKINERDIALYASRQAEATRINRAIRERTVASGLEGDFSVAWGVVPAGLIESCEPGAHLFRRLPADKQKAHITQGRRFEAHVRTEKSPGGRVHTHEWTVTLVGPQGDKKWSGKTQVHAGSYVTKIFCYDERESQPGALLVLR